MKKRIGTKITGQFETPLWITFYEYNDKIFASIYFTRQISPRYDDWFKDLQNFGFKIIPKGSYRYGYYYKIIASRPADTMQKLINELKVWEYDNNSFDIRNTVDGIFNKMVVEMI